MQQYGAVHQTHFSANSSLHTVASELRNVNVLVTPHGAGLTWLALANPHICTIELFPRHFVMMTYLSLSASRHSCHVPLLAVSGAMQTPAEFWKCVHGAGCRRQMKNGPTEVTDQQLQLALAWAQIHCRRSQAQAQAMEAQHRAFVAAQGRCKTAANGRSRATAGVHIVFLKGNGGVLHSDLAIDVWKKMGFSISQSSAEALRNGSGVDILVGLSSPDLAAAAPLAMCLVEVFPLRAVSTAVMTAYADANRSCYTPVFTPPVYGAQQCQGQQDRGCGVIDHVQGLQAVQRCDVCSPFLTFPKIRGFFGHDFVRRKRVNPLKMYTKWT